MFSSFLALESGIILDSLRACQNTAQLINYSVILHNKTSNTIYISLAWKTKSMVADIILLGFLTSKFLSSWASCWWVVMKGKSHCFLCFICANYFHESYHAICLEFCDQCASRSMQNRIVMISEVLYRSDWNNMTVCIYIVHNYITLCPYEC